MDKYEFVLFLMVMINTIFSFINLVVVDAAMQEYDRKRKKEETNDSSKM